MKKWVVAAKRADFDTIAKKFSISPMLARIIRNRDVIGDDAIDLYLNGTVDDMHDPWLLKDMDKAVSCILRTVEDGKKIFIIGDYDIDGVCASYILDTGISCLGGITTVRLPERLSDGYGMNTGMVDQAVDEGASLIITCDNGIAAAGEVEYAKEKGLGVVITDHHEVPFEGKGEDRRYIIPGADAVIDPKQADCNYPYEGICGGMVAYKLIQCLFERSGRGRELLPDLLMFAGFATVGDVMELKDENRIAVKYALERMKITDNIGMKCLIDVTGVDRSRLAPYHIGFILGPCINATGRLDSPMRALSMFKASDHEEALSIAAELKSLNESRKELTEKYKEEAIRMVEENDSLKASKVLVLYIPDCHESLAGIIAGKLREEYFRPAFVLTRSADGMVKGSGRSIEAYDMYSKLAECSDLFTGFGGHRMAAGLSLPEDNVDRLRDFLNISCTLTDDDMTEKLTADIALPLEYATMELANELDRLEPYGVGNSKPLFAQKDLMAKDIKVLGKNRNVVKFKLYPKNGQGSYVDAVMFGEGDKIAADLSVLESLSVMYELGINEYNGTKNVQLTIRDFR